MRRTAVSIPVNIAQGLTRHGKADKARFILLRYKSLPFSQVIFVLLVFLVVSFKKPHHQGRQGHQANWLRLCRSRNIAESSLGESRYYLILAQDWGCG